MDTRAADMKEESGIGEGMDVGKENGAMAAGAAPKDAGDVSLAEEQAGRPRRGLEGFYEGFRQVPLKYIDLFIIFCFLALFGDIIFGILKAKGIL